MACRFCATGKLGLTRSLAPGEMVDQVLCVARDFGARVTNAVAMGEGEPFATYDTTLGALRILNAPEGVGLGIGARHLTVSTCGLLPGIRQLSDEPEQFTLAVSLHSAVQKTRDYLLPRLSGSPLEQLRAALLLYAEKTGRRPTLEYAPIEGVNDTDAEIESLVTFCRKLLCHVNLIPLNPGNECALEPKGSSSGGTGASSGDSGSPGAGGSPRTGSSRKAGGSPGAGGSRKDRGVLKPSAAARVREIERKLTEAHIECTVRRSRGADILGACGQLAGR
jgi:adenine C2-methylase RlmN of 23S rRNA A2503 and tRNA A37